VADEYRIGPRKRYDNDFAGYRFDHAASSSGEFQSRARTDSLSSAPLNPLFSSDSFEATSFWLDSRVLMMKLFHSYALAKISAPFSTPSFLFSCVPDFLTRLANCLMLIGPDCGRIWADVPAAQDEIEGQVAVGHGYNRINRVGIAAAHHVAETLVDNIDWFALVIFGATIFEFCRDQVADAPQFHVPERVGRPIGQHHLAAFEHCPF